MNKYNVGQILTLSDDMEVGGEISGDKAMLKKGTRGWVGASKKPPMLHLQNGKILLLDKDTVIGGFSVTGLAEWIYNKLLFYFPLQDFFEDYDIEKSEFLESVAEALEELDMYDNTGNRS